MADLERYSGARYAAASDGSAGEKRRREVIGLLAIAVLALWIARPFISAVVCGTIIGIAVWPLFQRCRHLCSRDRGTPTVALFFTLAVGLILILPVAIAGADLAARAPAAEHWADEFQRRGVSVPGWLAHLPAVGPRIATWWQSHLSDPAGARSLLSNIDISALTSRFGLVLSGLADTSLLLLMVLLTFYYVVDNGEKLAEGYREFAKWLFGPNGDHLAGHMTEAVRGAVNGTVLVAFGEGAIIGLGYAAAGVPEPIMFTILTVVLALVPVGAWVACAVACLVLLLLGHIVAAAALFGWGAFVMLVGDHLVQPKLIGGTVRLPFMWTLIGILGGAEAFGLVGLFVGPVIMSTFAVMWREWLASRRQRRARR